MAKNTERDDLVQILTETLNIEGHEVDSEIERELIRLAKFILAKSLFDEDEESLDEEDDAFEEDEETLELDPENMEWPDDEEF